MFGLPHAETHAVVLPYVLALNAPAVPDLDLRMAGAFGADSALAGLLALRDGLGAPRALRDLGMARGRHPRRRRADRRRVTSDNPTPVTPENVESLLRAAWEGKEPT